MKKIILMFLLLWLYWNTYWYDSNDIKSFYITNITDWSNIYTIPDWKDLLITKILVYNTWSIENLQIRDFWWNTLMYVNWLINEYNNINILISESLEVKESNSIDNYTIVWILVNEWDDIQSIINNSDNWINKHIFNKETLQEIYQYESIIMIFIIFYNFMMRILWIRRKRKFINL